MSLSGDYWLLPNGELMSVAGSEHGCLAKIEMLGLKGRERVQFGRLGRHNNALMPEEVEIHRQRGVPEPVLSFLTAEPSVDPRIWAMREWGWIRIHPGVFNVWRLDDDALARIKTAHKYWSMQRALMDPHEMVTLNEESTGNMMYLPVKTLLAAESG